jgi:hypothetical protein
MFKALFWNLEWDQQVPELLEHKDIPYFFTQCVEQGMVYREGGCFDYPWEHITGIYHA